MLGITKITMVVMRSFDRQYPKAWFENPQYIVVIDGHLHSPTDAVPAGLARVVTHAEQLRARGYQQMRVQRVYLPMHDWTVLARATAFTRYPGSRLFPMQMEQDAGEIGHADTAVYEFALVDDGNPDIEADWRVVISGGPAETIESLLRCIEAPLVVITPIWWRTVGERELVVAAAEDIGDILQSWGIKFEIDLRTYLTVGERFRDQAMRGIPIRVEVGPRDVERDDLVVRRGDLVRTAPKHGVAHTVLNILTLDLGSQGMPGVGQRH